MAITKMEYSKNTTDALRFLREVIHWRLREHFHKQEADAHGLPELNIVQDGSLLLTETMIHNRLGFEECMLLLMTLYPHVEPNLLDRLIQEFLPKGGDFPEIGGIKAGNHRGTLPTGETALFIIAGEDLGRRLQLQVLLQETSALVKDKVLWLEPVKEEEPLMSGRLVLSPEWLHGLPDRRRAAAKVRARVPCQKGEYGYGMGGPGTRRTHAAPDRRAAHLAAAQPRPLTGRRTEKKAEAGLPGYVPWARRHGQDPDGSTAGQTVWKRGI